jgi:8-oxo-dGTP pyrophosphatase MutT (NUDIX family)
MPKLVKVKFEYHGENIKYLFSPIEKTVAEANNIPHGIAHCLVIKPDGTLLRIMRADNVDAYPGYNAIPGGHMDVLESNGKEICEAPVQAAERELYEETGLRSKKIFRILENDLIFDNIRGHVGFAFIHLVAQNVKPVYNHEVKPEKSSFERPEIILKRLKSEKFTPSSRKILIPILKNYNTQFKLKDFYRSLT